MLATHIGVNHIVINFGCREDRLGLNLVYVHTLFFLAGKYKDI
jgi:hypothetical protein